MTAEWGLGTVFREQGELTVLGLRVWCVVMGVGGWGRLEVKIVGGEQARVLEESPTRKLKPPRITRGGVLQFIREQGQGRAQTKGLGYRGRCAWLVNRAMGGCGALGSGGGAQIRGCMELCGTRASLRDGT